MNDRAADFTGALANQLQAMNMTETYTSSPTSTSSASASKKGKKAANSASFSDSFTSMSEKIIKDVRREVKARKRRRHDRKTTCAQCERKAEKGVKLFMCSRCRAVNYCSGDCQKTHWRTGHKADCANFVDPPFAKHFDPSEREDVPWPIDPIFGSANNQGVGMWVSTNSQLDSLLQSAHEPADRRVGPNVEGPPSYRRWAGLEGPKKRQFDSRTKAYIGSTLLGIKVIIHNRRADGRVVGFYLDTQALLAHPMFEPLLLPDQKVDRTPLGSNEVLLVEPWVDYNSKPRVAILEINGVSAPVGTWGPPDGRGEYVPPTQPAGDPWNRVLSWDKQWLALGAGDYAVVALQFRLGDGDACIDYPEVMRRTFGMQLRGILLDTTSTTPGWPAAARVEWNDPSSIIARMRNPVAAALAAMVMWDFSFLDEYYKPFFEQDADVFAETRLGTRAKHVNDLMRDTTGPMMVQTMLKAIQTLPPEKRAEAERRFAAMGYDMDYLQAMANHVPSAGTSPKPSGRR